MEKIYILFLLIFSALPMRSQTWAHKLETDPKTESVMTITYAEEILVEKLRKSYYDDILKSYKGASIASAGIFYSKQQERKALINAGLFTHQEFGYYKRILRLVSSMIMPKAVTVAMMMIEYPGEALFWGSYLYTLFQKVEQLCMIFECVVTNGSLSFSGVEFLQISDEFKALFDLAKLGNVDWKQVWEGMTNLNAFPTKEDLLEDLDNIIGQGRNLATAGYSQAAESWSIISNPQDLNFEKVLQLYDTYGDAYRLFDDATHIKQLVRSKLEGLSDTEALARILTLSNYNVTNFISDYVNQLSGRYYRQRWYIYYKDAGTENLCNYSPPTDDNSILYGDHWYRIDTKDADFYPNSSQREAALQNSESHAGWSRSRVQQLNSSKDGYTYSFRSYPLAYLLSKKKSGQYGKAYAYEIVVNRSWSNSEEVHEEVFDSETMDMTSFRALLDAKLAEFNDNEEGKVYRIGHDDKVYYELADKERIRDAEKVSFVVNCSDNSTLAEGGNSWKENGNYPYGSLGSDTRGLAKTYATKTTLSDDEDSFNEIDALIADKTDEVRQYQNDIAALKQRNTELSLLIYGSSLDNIETYRNEYNANKKEIESLEALLSVAQNDLTSLQNARNELVNDYSNQSDDYHRIPHYEHEITTTLHVTWTDQGYWQGNTYYRHGEVDGVNGVVTFICNLSLKRKQQRFLGVRVHRAILAIEWRLEANFTSSDVVDVINLDASASNTEKETLINTRLKEIQEEYPTCGVELDYAYSNNVQDSLQDNSIHLLWVSDRLEIARSVENQLRWIYSELMLIEKYMSSRRSIRDMIKSSILQVTHRSLERAAYGEIHRRWLHAADSVSTNPLINRMHDTDSP